MPSINFKGKNAVWNHHLSVPYQILEKDKKLSVKGKNEDENLIIEADNLLALKSLLPKYQGGIRFMYIDPPYNTGNEGWIYNDKVNSPLIKEWLGKAVGSDDLTRHDKWLCMMTPRLKLLYELLDEKGIIFISIDDNEVHFLKELMAEIFSIKEEDVFETPKPTKLIKEIIRATAPKDAIILDSFAGTGTTAHAVLDLNKEDGKSGNRKFILVQLPEKIEKDMPAYKAGFRFVHEIMRERVSKAIKMNKYEAGYSYMKLGSKIDADSILSGDLPSYKDFAKYVFYLATGKIMENEKSINEKD